MGAIPPPVEICHLPPARGTALRKFRLVRIHPTRRPPIFRRGQISVEVGRRSLDDRKRLRSPNVGNAQTVGSRRLIANVVVNDISAIRRPPVGLFITFTAEQQLFAAAPTHRLDVNVFLGATTLKNKMDAATPADDRRSSTKKRESSGRPFGIRGGLLLRCPRAKPVRRLPPG